MCEETAGRLKHALPYFSIVPCVSTLLGKKGSLSSPELHISVQGLSSGLTFGRLLEVTLWPLVYSAWEEQFCVTDALGHTVVLVNARFCMPEALSHVLPVRPSKFILTLWWMVNPHFCSERVECEEMSLSSWGPSFRWQWTLRLAWTSVVVLSYVLGELNVSSRVPCGGDTTGSSSLCPSDSPLCSD